MSMSLRVFGGLLLRTKYMYTFFGTVCFVTTQRDSMCFVRCCARYIRFQWHSPSDGIARARDYNDAVAHSSGRALGVEFARLCEGAPRVT